jgi:tripartite-type tricarboxylate transporter receptor subunit TctC
MRASRRVAIALAMGWLLAGAAAPAPVRAQGYPNRAVTIVSPYVAGGMSSLLGRAVGLRLEQRFGKSFVIENRPGGGTITGALSVAHAPPDGYTLLIAANATMATNVTLFKGLPFDPIADFIPLALVARVPEVLVVNAALPVHSLDDLVRLARSTPGGLTFGSAGLGSAQHINGELLKRRLGVEMTHIPYRGIAPALNDAAGGHIALMFTDIPIATPLINAGRLRPIGVTIARRVDALPDVPPLAEIGLPGFDDAAWFMFFAPARTPRAVVDRLSAAMREVIGDPTVAQELGRLGVMPPDTLGVDDLQAFMRTEIERAADRVRRAGLEGAEQARE